MVLLSRYYPGYLYAGIISKRIIILLPPTHHISLRDTEPVKVHLSEVLLLEREKVAKSSLLKLLPLRRQNSHTGTQELGQHHTSLSSESSAMARNPRRSLLGTPALKRNLAYSHLQCCVHAFPHTRSGVADAKLPGPELPLGQDSVPP